MYGKIDEVREILLSYNFDIFGLSESSISEDFYNAFFDIRGYRFIRRDRKIDQGGGVGLYTRMESILQEEPILKMTKLNPFGWKYS